MLVTLFLISCFMNQTVRYYMKYAIYGIFLNMAVMASFPLMLLDPFHPGNAFFVVYILRKISRYILSLTWSLHGLDNLVRGSGCVMVVNHQGSPDILALAEMWPVVDYSIVVAKKAMFYMWPFGLGSYLWGTLFVDRTDNKASQERFNKKAARVIKDKKATLCIFPEGIHNESCDLAPFKKGAFHVAIANQCPIQPVIISRYYWFDSVKKKFGSGHNMITVLPPISTEGLDLKDIDDVIKRTHDVMSAAYKDTSAKALSSNSKNHENMERNKNKENGKIKKSIETLEH